MTSPDPAASTAAPLPRIPLGATVAFLVIAFALAWLVSVPLWMDGGLANPWTGLLLPIVMFTPLVAVIIVMLIWRPVPKGQRLRFLGVWPLRPAKRVVWMCVIGLFGPVVIVAASVAIAALFGWVTLDLSEFSGFAETVAATLPAGVPAPPTIVLVLTQLASIPLAAATINALLAFGEELGWRGFLVPALRRYGTWVTLLLSGVIWGLWHTPITLLGYNFGRTDITGVLLTTAGCLCWGVLLGWLRLRSASVWPAVFAHGALNASAGLIVLLHAAGTTFDMALAGPLGVAGWIACAITVAILLVTGQLRRQPALAPPRATAPVVTAPSAATTPSP